MLQKKDDFKVKEGDKGPEITFLSNLGPKELSPMSPDAPMMYQDLHYNLESWSIFRLLPQLLHWEKAIIDFKNNVERGLAIIPSYEKERNPPSLWTYYQTLPKWCRDNEAIRVALFALEYHRPHLDIRQKELALNFTASLLRPVEGRLRKVITEVAMSNKIRINMETGK